MKYVLCVLALVAVFFAVGCSRKRTRASVPVSTRPPIPSVVGATEEGIASWYGHPYHGRRTANGEIYDQEKMTAAHPTLRFNTWVDVLNLSNGKRTQVRINDRGPFVKNRAIDLSRAAARAIDMLGPGTAPVRVLVIDPPSDAVPATRIAAASASPAQNSPPPDGGTPSAGVEASRDASPEPRYAVQVGAFSNFENAISLRDALLARVADVRILDPDGEGGFWRVWVGTRLLQTEAEELIERLRADFPRIFLVSDH